MSNSAPKLDKPVAPKRAADSNYKAHQRKKKLANRKRNKATRQMKARSR